MSLFFSVEQTQFNGIKLAVPSTPHPFPFPCFICLAVASRDQTVGTVQSAPFSGTQAPDQNLLALFAAGKITTSKKEPLLRGSDGLPPAPSASSSCSFKLCFMPLGLRKACLFWNANHPFRAGCLRFIGQ